jgi:hypothetical protein
MIDCQLVKQDSAPVVAYLSYRYVRVMLCLCGIVAADGPLSIPQMIVNDFIVSDYGLDDRAIWVRSAAGAKDFSSNLCVQTGSEAHPASCTMGTGGPFPGAKRGRGRDADHSLPSSAKVKNK